jgi:hypothetical protein
MNLGARIYIFIKHNFVLSFPRRRESILIFSGFPLDLDFLRATASVEIGSTLVVSAGMTLVKYIINLTGQADGDIGGKRSDLSSDLRSDLKEPIYWIHVFHTHTNTSYLYYSTLLLYPKKF